MTSLGLTNGYQAIMQILDIRLIFCNELNIKLTMIFAIELNKKVFYGKQKAEEFMTAYKL